MIFIVKQNGQIMPNTPVTFDANPGFNELGSATTQNTDGAGRITLALTATSIGSQTISATVGTQTINLTFNVVPDIYTLEAAPNTSDLHTATNVIFIFKRGGEPVPSGAPVIINANSAFTQLASSVSGSTDIWGQITLLLTAFTAGTQTVLATVDGQPVSVSMSVLVGAYNMEVSPATITKGVSASVTFTVKQGGFPVAANTPVVFNGNANFTQLATPVTHNTNGSGEIIIPLTALTAGSHIVWAMVGSQTINLVINVTS